ncbi:MAG: FG-GAP repeat protein [Methanomicrobiales archaeon]|nr:FG-GAP repeat protein [Methanomicrobiales archaeon]
MSICIVNAGIPLPAGKQGPFEEFRLTTGDAVDNAQYGRSVAIGGDLVAIGMGGDGAVGTVYLYRRQGMAYVPEAKLVAPDASPGAEFGRAVAIQGNRVIVGARFAQVGTLSKAGAAYVFRKYGGSWHFEEKITSPNPANEDNFGRALAVEGDLLVVTARKEKTDADDVGAAYVFRYRGGSWTYQEKLTASDPAPGAYFGQSVALQGDLLAIGARNADPNGAGGFYLFRRSGNGWMEFAKVTPPNGKKNDQYGFSIAFTGDTIVVGARRADMGTSNPDTGAAYVYSLQGDSVELVTKLTASDAEAYDEFGQSVALAGDIIAVGAWKDDIGDNLDQGSIYLFRRAGGEWIGAGKVAASDGMAGDEFGYSLAAFGNRLVTGAHTADFISPDGGAAYVLPLKP